MELDIPPHDKLYYIFVTGSKDAKKLYTTTNDYMITHSMKGSNNGIEIIVALSKKLTDNAYFQEAKLFN